MVVPFAGTWIEMNVPEVPHLQRYCRSLRGNVD